MTDGELAKALGGSFNGQWFNIRGPGPSCEDKSLGFRFDPQEPDGIRIFSFAGDDPDVCRQHIINKLSSLSEQGWSVAQQDVHEGVDRADANAAKAFLIWDAALGAVGTPVEKYLATRGCLPDSLDLMTDAVRFHPNCPMRMETVPAMVSMMRDINTGQPTGIHRTALADDGATKRTMPNGLPAKMMMGRAKGAAVMLSNSAPIMGIAEGIETALRAHKIFGMPVWACMSASGIAGFPALHDLNHLTIFADHDKTGIFAARKCAARLFKAGIKGVMKYPSSLGDDWNCYLQKGTNNVS
jgi:putative DNA primase/helicase